MEHYDKYDNGGLLRNRYSKVSDISEGSYGLVSLAKDTHYEDTLVAVKYIFPVDYKRKKNSLAQLSNVAGRATSSPAKLRSNSGLSDSTKKVMVSALCEESSKEISIHKILGDHPNIPKLIDHFDSYLILEYCSKGDLYEAMQNGVGPTTSQDIKDVFAQILSAISFCHSQSVYHRDLKPENILIAQDWSIKVCDWGLATTQQIITNPAEFDIGSERYMAPELFDPDLRSYDAAKVDLWSLGVILLTLVFHKNPFQIANYTDKRFLQFSANREALFDFFSSMTGEMFSALRFCLTMDPSNRDLESFREELQNINYFTIDEEYWAAHSEEDEDHEVEELDFEEDDTDDEQQDITLPEVSVQSEDTFQFDSDIVERSEMKEFSHHHQEEHPKPYIPAISSHNTIAFSIDEALENRSIPVQAAESSSSDDDTVPYNRRADALLSPTSNAKPIPIGANHHIRNTRKPFGVASYNKSGTSAPFQKQYNGFNGYSNSQGNRFRREDFFTPRSVFTHYMDKYGESKERGDLRTQDRKKKVWNSGRKKQSWKKRGFIFQSYQNGSAQGSGHETHSRKIQQRQPKPSRQSRPSTANPSSYVHNQATPSSFVHNQSSPSHHSSFINGISPQSAHGGLRNMGKYVPPFLRSPHSHHKRVPVDELSEDIENIALTDGEVFVLEEDYHDAGTRSRESGNSYHKHENMSLFDLSDESSFESRRDKDKRALAPKEDDRQFNITGKYVPPFRRSSMGFLTEKKRPFMPHASPFNGFSHNYLSEEAARSVPDDTWNHKRG